MAGSKNPLRLPSVKELEEDARRIESKRRKALPERATSLRTAIWAQVRLLKEMGRNPNFCDRVMELFRIEEELASEVECIGCGHGILPEEKINVYCVECSSKLRDKTMTFEQFWNEVPESHESDMDQCTHARMRAVAHAAFVTFGFE